MQLGATDDNENPIILGVDIGHANCRLFFRSANIPYWTAQVIPMAVCKNEKHIAIFGQSALDNMERGEKMTRVPPLKLKFDTPTEDPEWEALCRTGFRRMKADLFESTGTEEAEVVAAMSIPLHYSSKSRERVCRFFGLPDIERINDPEAAILGYELDKEMDGDPKHVLVLNIGAHSCWCALLKVSEFNRTLHTEILSWEQATEEAYGDVFDQNLTRILLESNPKLKSYFDTINMNRDAVLGGLAIKIQRAKHDYIRDPKKTMTLSYLPYAIDPVAWDMTEVEAMADLLATHVQALIERTLSNAGVKAQKVACTLPVGGMTLLPQVIHTLRPYRVRANRSGWEKNDALFCLAKGAARYAEIRTVQRENALNYVPVQHPIFGVMLEGNRFDAVVSADSPLDVKHTKVYRASTRETHPVRFEIYYGFSKKPHARQKIGEILYEFAPSEKSSPDEIPLHLSMEVGASASDFPDTLKVTLEQGGYIGVGTPFLETRVWRETNPGQWQELK